MAVIFVPHDVGMAVEVSDRDLDEDNHPLTASRACSPRFWPPAHRLVP
jgi:hypothetical protein